MSTPPATTTGPIPTLGSLFTGYLGLDLALDPILKTELTWVCDNDPGATRILEHRAPGTPNLGDITHVDWHQIPPVDILTGGFPCQDVSAAGRRDGLGNTRTGLWHHMVDAIDTLRPTLVIAENVRGILNAPATSHMEPCPWCMGNNPDQPPMRALGAVLADMAELRYDVRWCGLRAADVGAPHGRFRIFIAAWNTDLTRLERRHTPERPDQWPTRATSLAPPHPSDERHERPRQPRRRGPRPTHHNHDTPTDTNSTRRSKLRLQDQPNIERTPRDIPHRRDNTHTQWGPYEPAIRRWEHTLQRPAPPPTQPGRNNKPQLSPRFVEWMMGLPAGWVTDTPNLTRNQQLRALGNGVVPQQAHAAITHLLEP